MPLLPSQPGPWRNIVKKATQQAPEHRPQTMDALVALIERELSTPPEEPLERAAKLVGAANLGDTSAADDFLSLLADHPRNYELYVGRLTQLTALHAGQALARDSSQAHAVLGALAEHVGGDGSREVRLDDACVVVAWAHRIVVHAAAEHEWDLLEDAAEAMCVWDAAWHQHGSRDDIEGWLQSLKGNAAAAVSSVLRAHPGSAVHFSGLAESRAADPLIRQAVRGGL
ncbi:hypothetical protein GCM10010304_06390 [Streptomyces roseoviolaceus]